MDGKEYRHTNYVSTPRAAVDLRAAAGLFVFSGVRGMCSSVKQDSNKVGC